jgi:hypothetical protein
MTRTHVFYLDELLGVSLTAAEFDALTPDDFWQALRGYADILKAPDGSYVLYDYESGDYEIEEVEE